jgi:hypothetical protein
MTAVKALTPPHGWHSRPENGSAAFHGGELEVACRSILFRLTRQPPPWKTAPPEGGEGTALKLTRLRLRRDHEIEEDLCRGPSGIVS